MNRFLNNLKANIKLHTSYLHRNISTIKSNGSGLNNLWNTYNHYLQTKPLLTKSITSGIISLAADIICQINFPVHKKIDSNNRDNSNKIVTNNDEIVVIDKDKTSYGTNSLDLRRMANFTIIGIIYKSIAIENIFIVRMTLHMYSINGI